jgi:hypothetical protein
MVSQCTHLNDYGAKSYHLGLTAERLVVLPFKDRQLSGRALSIQRENIKSLKWSGSNLVVQLEHNTLSISCRQGHWKTRAKELADLNTQTPVPDGSITSISSQERLQQIQDFHALDLLASAQSELSKVAQFDPSLSADPAVVSVREKTLFITFFGG